MEPDALDASHADRGEAEVMLQESEFSLNSRATAVQAAPFVTPAGDAEVPFRLTFPERHDCRAAAFVALGVDAVVVVRLVHCDRLRLEAAGAHRVEQRRDVEG